MRRRHWLDRARDFRFQHLDSDGQDCRSTALGSSAVHGDLEDCGGDGPEGAVARLSPLALLRPEDFVAAPELDLDEDEVQRLEPAYSPGAPARSDSAGGATSLHSRVSRALWNL